ncbi:Malate/L-lactate dehydrogenase [Aspergillus minisclerotigenes]|uniref:Malate/L-lactate dehydrogenase n=1 Tax=Aspergillus minisclerotigenes TaxID=656917 RepID=A0A5N6JFB6_9EURO|nr:Malate/L-lactate dehydrogenase [Aspergillus minisclerotigenes]
MALLDAKNTFGFVAGSLAIDKCIEMAHTYGMGMVSVRNSDHYGMEATCVLRAIEQGFAYFAYMNASRAMPPWGGAEALLGTSPFAVGVPGGGGFRAGYVALCCGEGEDKEGCETGGVNC